jgi:Putative methyltransferase
VSARPAPGRDWYQWHEAYDDAGSLLARRLAVVQQRLRVALDEARPGPLRLLSLVAGQGRDVIPVLAAHPRREDVDTVLVELDPRNARAAEVAAAGAGLAAVTVRVADAGLADGYADAVPADILLLCGLFGNISDEDVRATVEHAAALVRTGGTVLWTRHRRPPDLVPRIDSWLVEQGFVTRYLSDPALDFGVGAHRAGRPGPPVPAGTRLFTFVGMRALREQSGAGGAT